MESSKKKNNRCTFCGRSEKEVELLITGLNGFICETCARQAYEITQEMLKTKNKAGNLSLKDSQASGNQSILRSVCDRSGRGKTILGSVCLQPLQTSASERQRR